MATLDELKGKYATVLEAVTTYGVRLSHLHVQDDKLYLEGAAPSEEIKNKIWDAIKSVDASYSDLTANLSVDSSLPQPAPPAPAAQSYTVVAGDSLWKISEKFYGNGSLFHKIIEGNPDQLKDEKSVIHPGDVLNIPAA
ncbi:MAG TPA: LysM peptidoglycan-binding domain-containing protein [Bryobacteraceae bacterium]|jgi:LysM repeat protein|nr:LysM peptidoglycan-binding domain-containing protein [Bryobacteraceae bacterium]